MPRVSSHLHLIIIIILTRTIPRLSIPLLPRLLLTLPNLPQPIYHPRDKVPCLTQLHTPHTIHFDSPSRVQDLHTCSQLRHSRFPQSTQ